MKQFKISMLPVQLQNRTHAWSPLLFLVVMAAACGSPDDVARSRREELVLFPGLGCQKPPGPRGRIYIFTRPVISGVPSAVATAAALTTLDLALPSDRFELRSVTQMSGAASSSPVALPVVLESGSWGLMVNGSAIAEGSRFGVMFAPHAEELAPLELASTETLPSFDEASNEAEIASEGEVPEDELCPPTPAEPEPGSALRKLVDQTHLATQANTDGHQTCLSDSIFAQSKVTSSAFVTATSSAGGEVSARFVEDSKTPRMCIVYDSGAPIEVGSAFSVQVWVAE